MKPWCAPACAGLLLLGGCVLVYVPSDAATAHGLHDRERGALPNGLLQPGKATREELLLALGAPDRVLADGRALLWVGASVEGRWYLVVGGLGGGAVLASPSGSDYLLLVEFDAEARVVRHHFRSAPLGGHAAALPELYAAIGRDEPPSRAQG